MISYAYMELLRDMQTLHERKSAGYSGDNPDPWYNMRRCEVFGIPATHGAITRMTDKWSRLESLWKSPDNEQVGEPLRDTLIDLASYALILVCLLDEQATEQKESSRE